jgi:hypothetical protein
MTDLTERTSDFIKDLGEAARRNPISAALIGMGAVWLLTGGRPVEGGSALFRAAGLDRASEATKNTMAGVVSSATDAFDATTNAVREGAADTFQHASRLGAEYRNALPNPADMMETARDRLGNLFEAQPLALGAIGLAIGAGIAAALPTTAIEESYLGETSAAVKNRASDIVGRQVEKAATLASDAAGAAAEEAQRQALTVENAKAAIEDLSGRVGRVATAAGSRAGPNEPTSQH